MTTNNSSSVWPEVGDVSITDTCFCLNRSLSFISIQASGCLVHDLGSNEHLPGVDSVGPYPTMNHVAPSTMGYDDPPHLAMVSVRFTIDLYAHIIDGVFAEGPWRTSREPKSFT